MPLQPKLQSIGDAEVRRLASEILGREEYAQYRALPAEWARELLELIGRLFELLPQLYVKSPFLYLCVLIGMIAVAALLLAHVIWSLRAAMRAPSEARASTPRAELDFVAEARELAERGSYLQASHRLLLASLAHSARAHLLELKPEDGNRVVCDKLRRADLHPVLRQQLIELIGRTDAVWFGHRTQNADLYEAWLGTYDRLRRSAG